MAVALPRVLSCGCRGRVFPRMDPTIPECASCLDDLLRAVDGEFMFEHAVDEMDALSSRGAEGLQS